jgi:hypothetical protein
MQHVAVVIPSFVLVFVTCHPLVQYAGLKVSCRQLFVSYSVGRHDNHDGSKLSCTAVVMVASVFVISVQTVKRLKQISGGVKTAVKPGKSVADPHEVQGSKGSADILGGFWTFEPSRLLDFLKSCSFPTRMTHQGEKKRINENIGSHRAIYTRRIKQGGLCFSSIATLG